jgi:hypothetical protein
MAEETKPAAEQAIEKKSNGDGPVPAASQAITPEYVALEKLNKPELVSLAAQFFSSKTTFGPDPETAKLMAQTEMHHETCRLEAYKKNLENQEQDGRRDHEFRLKRLNRDTFLMGMVLVLALAGAGTGLYLTITDQRTLGSNILIASVALIYYIIGGKTPFSKKDE